jgi:hypothetical protein
LLLAAPSAQVASLQLRDVRRAMTRLPVEQRQVLLVVGLEGMNYDEAASVLGVPIGTVRSRLSRGRTMLRKLLGLTNESFGDGGAELGMMTATLSRARDHGGSSRRAAASMPRHRPISGRRHAATSIGNFSSAGVFDQPATASAARRVLR